MKPAIPQYAYILATLAGVALVFITNPFIVGIFYLVAGALLGYLWPLISWRWGLWLVGPITALLSLSILFAGQLDVFLKKDLPLFLIALVCGCLGSFTFSLLKKRSKNSGDDQH